MTEVGAKPIICSGIVQIGLSLRFGCASKGVCFKQVGKLLDTRVTNSWVVGTALRCRFNEYKRPVCRATPFPGCMHMARTTTVAGGAMAEAFIVVYLKRLSRGRRRTPGVRRRRQ